MKGFGGARALRGVRLTSTEDRSDDRRQVGDVTGADDRIAGAEDFTSWYEAAWPRVVRAVSVFTGAPGEAADIAAEAVTRVFERWQSPARPADPTTWTIVVAINLAKRRGQRDRRGRELSVVDPTPAELGATDIDLWRAVRRLPPREREAIALRYGSDLTEPAVADAMGITPGAAAATLHRARTKLRALLSESHDG